MAWRSTQPLTVFWSTPDQNRQRVVCAELCELFHLPYILMLLMVYCIRRKRSSLVTINFCAHVVEETSGGQTEGKQKVVAKTQGLDAPHHNFDTFPPVASREYPCGDMLVGREQSQTHMACTWTRHGKGRDFHKHKHFQRLREKYHGVVPPLSPAHH